jgi:hypothetical protein
MYPRRVSVTVTTVAVAVGVLLALQGRRATDHRTDFASDTLRDTADTATQAQGSQVAPAVSRHHLSRSLPSNGAAIINASAIIDRVDSIPTTDSAVPGEADATAVTGGADTPSDPQRPADSKPPLPKFWRLTGDSHTLLTDHETVHTGLSSAVLQAVPGQAGTDSTIAVFQACSAIDFRGMRAQFTIYLLGDDNFGTAEAWLRVDDPTNVNLPVNVVRMPATLPTPPVWASVSVAMDVSATATVLTYGVILHGSGRLWMDTAKLGVIDAVGLVREEASRDPSPTDMLMNTSPAPRYPRNMDFEEFLSAR